MGIIARCEPPRSYRWSQAQQTCSPSALISKDQGETANSGSASRMNGGFVPCSARALRIECRSFGICALKNGARSHVAPSRWRVHAPVMAAPVEVTEESFSMEVLKSDIPVLVDFHAAWCGPCKLVAPLMDWAATEFDGRLKIVKIDTEENKSFVTKYGVHGLPTFAVFKNGEAFGVQEGALGKKGLKEYIEKHTSLVAAE